MRSTLPVRAAHGAGAGVQPAQALVGEHHAQVELVGRAVLERVADQARHRVAVVGVDDAVEEVAVARRLRAPRQAVHRAHVVGPLDDVGIDVPLPEAGLRPFQGEPEALLEAPHRGAV